MLLNTNGNGNVYGVFKRDGHEALLVLVSSAMAQWKKTLVRQREMCLVVRAREAGRKCGNAQHAT